MDAHVTVVYQASAYYAGGPGPGPGRGMILGATGRHPFGRARAGARNGRSGRSAGVPGLRVTDDLARITDHLARIRTS